MQNHSSSSSLMHSITMEEQQHQQQPKLIKDHGFKENPSQTIMRLASLAIGFNVRLKSSDMPAHMQEHALRHTRSLLSLSTPSPKLSNTLIARALKKEFDTKYGLAWHCVIGKSFGSFVSHTGGGFIYFSIDTLSVLLFKTEVHLVRQPPP
ncbi:dynein light chain 1, cytoplasmic-like [Vigna unguiculata]|uniref:Dynein light chain n=1 Tax=Vigna unguiculata TaxID=3917 RepID=A0A4D6NAN3_VIGUN|nr:dynein light chain 1, cytoplasmic-like [Vigna unguiculata]QCE09931.1 dynein light chain LC8-type [Vigna unguiculata]